MNQTVSPIKEAAKLTLLLKAVLGEDRFPINVEQLALEYTKNFDDPITKVKKTDIDGFEGMLRAHRKKPAWHIIYNQTPLHTGRERFTQAHELGHYMLHRPRLSLEHYPNNKLIIEADFNCSPLQENRWGEEEKQREKEADIFASYLLMPIDDYRLQAQGQDVSEDFLKHVTNRYDVSLTAAVIKWIEFTNKRAAIVVSRDGFALWGRASKPAYKSGIFISSGMEIPSSSVASQGLLAKGLSDKPVELKKGTWWPKEEVAELAIFSEQFGICISILLFGEAPNQWHEKDEENVEDTFDRFQKFS